MRPIHDIEFFAGSRKERLPGFAPDFPYIASWVEIDRYPRARCALHWHSAVENSSTWKKARWNTARRRALVGSAACFFLRGRVCRSEAAFQADLLCVLLHPFDGLPDHIIQRGAQHLGALADHIPVDPRRQMSCPSASFSPT